MLCNARMTPENPLMNLFSNLRGGVGYFQKTKISTLYYLDDLSLESSGTFMGKFLKTFY